MRPWFSRATGGYGLVKLFSIFLFLLSASALANPFVIKTKTGAHPDTGISHEVETTAAASPEEAEAALKYIEKNLAEAVAKNPGLKPEIVIARGEGDAAAQPGVAELEQMAKRVAQGRTIEQVAIPEGAIKSARSKFKEWFESHYRVSFTIIRGVANFGTVAWGLAISPSIPWEASLSVGLVAGGMSAGLMWFNDAYNKFVRGAETNSKFRAEFRKWRRTYYVGAAYLAVTQVTSALSGVPMKGALVATLGEILTTAFIGTVAQGSWTLYIADEEGAKLEKVGIRVARERNVAINKNLLPEELHGQLIALAKTHAPKEYGQLKFQTSLKVLAVSMVSTAITIGVLMNVPHMDIGLYALAASGIAMRVKALFHVKQWKKVRDAQIADCAKYLLPPTAAAAP